MKIIRKERFSISIEILKIQSLNPKFIAGSTLLNLYDLQSVFNSHLVYSSWLFGVIE